MDQIELKNLVLSTCHGVLPAEQTCPQKFSFDVVLSLNLRPAGRSDDLRKTVNYAEIQALVTRVATQNKFKLIECLAETLCSAILEFSPLISQVRLTVRKLHPPMEGALDYVAVTLLRTADGTLPDSQRKDCLP